MSGTEPTQCNNFTVIKCGCVIECTVKREKYRR